jgi:hypothetical protein
MEKEKAAVKERMRSEPEGSNILNRVETGEAAGGDDRLDSSEKASSMEDVRNSSSSTVTKVVATGGVG